MAQSRTPATYAAWQNGPWRNPQFFPIAVWWQEAIGTGHTGPYPTTAAAAAASHINILLGQGENWPEQFGADYGEIEAAHQYGLYIIGGTTTPYNENTSSRSVASMLALAERTGTQSNLIGYNAGDEPQCQGGSQIGMWAVPSIVAGIHRYDPTRIVTFNHADWMIQPQWQTNPASCLNWDVAALQQTSIASFDYYPITNAFPATNLGVGGSDFTTVSNDSLWVQGVSVGAMAHFARAGEPLWAYIEAGGDNLGFSEQNNHFNGGVTAGSTTLTSASRTRFSRTWIGLTVSGGGIPGGTRITAVTDPTHAVLSQSATASASVEQIDVTGGVADSDCVASANLCVANGNQYRPTPAQVGAEVWMSIINGANGIEYFCHDLLSSSFCLGDSGAAGNAATVTQQNIAAINQAVLAYAPVINASTVGMCSMQQFDTSQGTVSTTQSCADGSFAMISHDPAIPSSALVKSYGGKTYLFAQSDRRTDHGVAVDFRLSGLAGHRATVVYDSNQLYDRPNAKTGDTISLNSIGQFTDILGASHDDYQVKIYRID